MKPIIYLFLLLLAKQAFPQEITENKTNYLAPIYQYMVKDVNGNDFDFGCLEGKKILIINTASKCMFSQQLYDLQKLYNKYKNSNFVVVAFPSNSFYNREPNGNCEIATNYLKKYGIDFPIMSKCAVKGDTICQVYSYLTNIIENGVNNNTVKWNFQKYLINENGYLYKTIDPKINPLDKEIVDWIESK